MKPIKQIVLHLGMHKTGTTAIQHSLKGYCRDGVRYADWGYENHSIALVTVFSSLGDKYHIHQRIGRSAEAVAKLKASWELDLQKELKRPAQKLIFSAEDGVILSQSELAVFRDCLLDHSENITVIVYLRETVSFIISVFQELVKNGKKDYALALPAYREKFEKIIKVFGRENIEFVPYVREQLVDACVVTDFCSRLGIGKPELPLLETNKGLSRETASLLVKFNQEGRGSLGELVLCHARNRLIHCLTEAFPGYFSLNHSFILSQLDEEDIYWMEKQTGFSLLNVDDQDQEQSFTESSAQDEMEQVAESSIPKLKQLLISRNITVTETDTVVDMLNKLYASLLNTLRYRYALANTLRDLAVKMETPEHLTLADASKLMRVAQRFNPDDPVIREKMSAYSRSEEHE